ncbi:MobA/MobL family protein [Palleronia aestuarii]|uniref:MobA/MobL family protein n=1 Tax=Palleronia aestuarii TaxID=568105 RepID=UPI001B86D0EE|nr:MobA/MobL family protein [Palleronia aestuarii]
MAIAFARARYLSRSTGGSAVRSACYNARVAITDARTGERFSFAHREAPEHHTVLLPEGAEARLGDSAVLWNLAEGAERRKDAQVAREIVLALPADAGLTHDDHVALAESFARAHFVARGLAVQIDIHAPHAGEGGERVGRAERLTAAQGAELSTGQGAVILPGPDGSSESERTNPHAHLLITTRRVEGDRLSAKKARDLDPAVRTLGGRSAVTDGDRWGELWRAHQDAYFAAHGLELRVDALTAVPGQHVGPVRMRVPGSEAVARAEENARAARDPDRVLEALTRGNASFTERRARPASREAHLRRGRARCGEGSGAGPDRRAGAPRHRDGARRGALHDARGPQPGACGARGRGGRGGGTAPGAERGGAGRGAARPDAAGGPEVGLRPRGGGAGAGARRGAGGDRQELHARRHPRRA